MYRLTFEGLCRDFPDLLSAMQHRKHILDLCPAAHPFVAVWQRTGDDWTFYDAEKFLSGLAALLAPADNVEVEEASVVIISLDEADDDGRPLFWNDTEGWVDREWASEYTDFEQRNSMLPLGGRWVSTDTTADSGVPFSSP
jgi:hypothetical protein